MVSEAIKLQINKQINLILHFFTVVLREQLAIKVDLKEERVEVSRLNPSFDDLIFPSN